MTTVSLVISVSGAWRWAVASNERALENARAAAVECSRRRLERAEVEDYLDEVVAAHTATPVLPRAGHA